MTVELAKDHKFRNHEGNLAYKALGTEFSTHDDLIPRFTTAGECINATGLCKPKRSTVEGKPEEVVETGWV